MLDLFEEDVRNIFSSLSLRLCRIAGACSPLGSSCFVRSGFVMGGFVPDLVHNNATSNVIVVSDKNRAKSYKWVAKVHLLSRQGCTADEEENQYVFCSMWNAQHLLIALTKGFTVRCLSWSQMMRETTHWSSQMCVLQALFLFKSCLLLKFCPQWKALFMSCRPIYPYNRSFHTLFVRFTVFISIVFRSHEVIWLDQVPISICRIDFLVLLLLIYILFMEALYRTDEQVCLVSAL